MKICTATCILALATTSYAQQIPDRATLNTVLSGNLVLEDFEVFQVTSGNATILASTPSLDSTTMVAGQGPGLVQPGARYIDPTGTQLQWNGDSYFGLGTKTFMASANTVGVGMGELFIEYNPPVTAMGLDVTGFDCCGFSGTMTVKDTSGTIIGSVGFNYAATPNGREFVGWQHAAGIGSVEIVSPIFLWSPIIDDHGYGVGTNSIGTSYCSPAVTNSTGNSGVISATGSAVVANNDLTLTASQLPTSAFGFFLTSMTQASIAQPGGSQGVLCLGGAIGRYVAPGQIQSSGNTGSFSLAIDLANHPTPTGLVSVGVGETWNFQAWHRDSIGGVATSNFTDALEVQFQ